MPGRFEFPDPVNDTSARVVASGVVAMTAAAIAADEPVLLAPLVYGFAARVLSGPRYSPLGLLATRVVTPRLKVAHTFSPGPPKRLAQGMGLALSASALVLRVGLRRRRASQLVLGALLVAATLEAAFGICLACRMYPYLVRAGLVPEDACEDCARPPRLSAVAAHPRRRARDDMAGAGPSKAGVA